jgi:hypothetical protein
MYLLNVDVGIVNKVPISVVIAGGVPNSHVFELVLLLLGLLATINDLLVIHTGVIGLGAQSVLFLFLVQI